VLDDIDRPPPLADPTPELSGSGVASAAMRRLVLLAVAAGLVAAACQPGGATVTIAHWEMNEGPGASVMVDSGPKKINGSVGSAVQTGVNLGGATGYRWPWTAPDTPPAKPERLALVPDSRLNPGTRDYAVTVRFRTTTSAGNIIQKGQALTAGGYFKWEIPAGRIFCLFTSRDSQGNLLGERGVRAPRPLNNGAWHTVRCEKTADQVTMTIDGSTVVRSAAGPIGPIANTMPLSIGGKYQCDEVSVDCDYFVGDIDWVRIEASSA
jgi:hypothetical protein